MRRLGVTSVGLVMSVWLAGACGPLAQAPPKVSPGPTAPTTADSPAASPSPSGGQNVGFLDGRASIGPLQPVERIGVPTPTPPPAACTSRGLVIFSAATGQEVNRISFGADCTYRVALPPGAYRVDLAPSGIDRSRSLPQTVTINAGQTTRLDVNIDTGIR